MAHSDSRQPQHTTYAQAAASSLGENARIGPHPGHIKSSTQYTAATATTTAAAAATTSSHSNGSYNGNSGDHAPAAASEATPDVHRIQAVQLIDSVRQQLRLPVRTFDTACVYYHHFRLRQADCGGAGASYQDSALASLFVACKVEDTIKKSKEILAAAYTVRNEGKHVTPDDKMFEAPGKIIIGLERLILETIGFDFRTRYPQKMLVKVLREIIPRDQTASASASVPPDQTPEIFSTAYAMTIDMYKTLVPIKRTTFSMVMAVTELTLRLLKLFPPPPPPSSASNADPPSEPDSDPLTSFTRRKRQFYSRPAVLSTMLDLLDLYIQHLKSTKLGPRLDLSLLMHVKIQLNGESHHLPQPPAPLPCTKCAEQQHHRSPTPTQDPAMRFVFDPEAAARERDMVAAYFSQEFEDVEVEVDEDIPPPPIPPISNRGGGAPRPSWRWWRQRQRPEVA
ncbi:hypothetical protein GMORB2_6561 [Geosmithia morbida]|uniref:RNA polymerase II holoenzyme cyclin-like subunit n=1 Tax=Geosmithia morbida TaxID=1094350 RepID=A0A9P4YWL0_9HYPO|nr:uncharacterized protein GMORB2_6561 [Geosmithia morbida]KAF4123013.1 hypothetical protein GMORB2_6561 [Geosmithia morbida]